MTAGRIQVNADSVKARLSRGQAIGIFLSFRWSGPAPPEDLEVVTEAVTVANAAVDPDLLAGHLAGRNRRGPLVVLARHPDHTGAHVPWLAAVVTHLEARGLTARIVPTQSRWRDEGVPRPGGRMFPTIFAAYPIVDSTVPPPPVRGWLTNAVTTRVASQVLASSLVRNMADVRIGLAGMGTDLDPEHAAEAIAGAAAVSQAVHLDAVVPEASLRSVSLSSPGYLLYRESEPATGWRELLDRARALLGQLPPELDHAFIRGSGGLGGPFPSSADFASLLNFGAWVLSRHLWAEYAYDAHGVNILTSAHLEKAHDLSGWVTERTAAGRYVVRARDLEPWFAGPVDPRLQGEARADFGDMILTEMRLPRGAFDGFYDT